jgi:hypothetical protein
MIVGILSLLISSQLPVDIADRVISASDDRQIMYSMIDCGSAYRERPEACHELEQQRLDTRLRRQWIESARKVYTIELTAKEEADVNRRVAAEHAFTEKAAERFRALAVAALRIRQGEDRATVLSDLSRQGIRTQELDWELEQLPTVAAAQKVASKDFVADGERAAREYHTTQYVVSHLRKMVERRVASRRVSFETAEEQFWSEIVAKTHTRIVDPSYRLPPRKGVLVSHEQQTQIAQ